ncbi:hypothetical protein FACS189487_00940 [Campylobacterota bacterium]|nr:hypothetical protein FACS189487_00940 [Campylobacterota bacterium]
MWVRAGGRGLSSLSLSLSLSLGALLLAALFSLTACGGGGGGGGGSTPPSGGGSTLSGAITIQKGGTNVTTATTGDTLTAHYTGGESVTFQWNKNGSAIATDGTSQSYSPAEAGTYTVTVSFAGYPSKTSAGVSVSGTTLLTLSGAITIQKDDIDVTTAKTLDLLKAKYTGGESVTYDWSRDSVIFLYDYISYEPWQAGSYTVTVRAAGYASKTSIPVTVTLSILKYNPVIYSESGDHVIGRELTADYGGVGSETINSYQWNKNGAAIPNATNQKYTPTEVGSYTVTVTAQSYESKTSAPVTITVPTLKSMIKDLPSGTRSNPSVLTLTDEIYPITDATTILLSGKHIRLKVPTGKTVTIQVTEALSGSAFTVSGSSLILGEASGGGTLIIDGGKTSGITNARSIISVWDGVSQGGYVEINNGVTLRNNKTTGSGGAVNVSGVSGAKSTLKMAGGIISGNNAAVFGGGIQVGIYANFDMTGGIIENNNATDTGMGGGIGSWNGGERSDAESWAVINISGGEIRNNTAITGNGGGIYSHAKTTISGTAKIHHNHADWQGGGIYKVTDATHANNILTFTPKAWSEYVYENTSVGIEPQVSPVP